MLLTYKAILRGNQLEWHGDAPPHLNQQEQVAVYVTILEEEAPLSEDKAVQGLQMAQALKALAALPTHSLDDPLAWEREQRRERDLPQRP